MQAHFIVIEGVDGSGTTTQAKRLVETLGADAVFTCEPTDGKIGKLLRQALAAKDYVDPRTLALLFAADRRMHEFEIRDWMRAGLTVVSDRYLLSSWVYQGLDLPLTWVRTLNEDVLVPTLTVLLDVDPLVAAARRAARGGETELFDAPPTQRILARRYGELIHSLPGRTAVVDGSGTPGQVARAVLGAVQSAVQSTQAAKEKP